MANGIGNRRESEAGLQEGCQGWYEECLAQQYYAARVMTKQESIVKTLVFRKGEAFGQSSRHD